MLINEIKATPYPYNISTDDHGDESEFTGLFRSKDGSKVEVLLYLNESNEGELSFSRDGEHELSSKGDQFKILFTVVEIIKELVSMALKDGRMTKLVFLADGNEPSRIKLYTNKVVPLISSLLGSKWKSPRVLDFSGVVEFSWISENHLR